jgi:ribonuclease BN (tRNA processing enzyme)
MHDRNAATTSRRTMRLWPTLLCAAIAGLAALPASAADSAPAPKRMELVTLGTGGGPSVRLKRAQTSSAIAIGEDIYLIDSADGVLRQLAAADLPIERIKAVFITHHHFDHNADLGTLLVQRWLFHYAGPQIKVLGPPMTRDMVTHLAKAFRATELAPIFIGQTVVPGIAETVEATDIPGDLQTPTVIYEDANVRVSAVLNDHYHFPAGSAAEAAARSYAFRFDTPQRSITFTGDTGPSERVAALARGSDVLVSEVIDIETIETALRANPRPGFPMDELIEHLHKNHLTPPQVGELAARAGVKEVILHHLVPGYDEETDMSRYTRGIDRHFKGPVRVARDLDRY